MSIPHSIIAVLFTISPFATFWMVYRVLRDATPSEKTFDDYWYEGLERQSGS